MESIKKLTVAVAPCTDYGDGLGRILEEMILSVDDLSWVVPGMTVAIKANLVAASKPEEAAVTHPRVVEEVCRMLTSRGACVIIGDSPGGTYSVSHLEHVYREGGYLALEREGVRLNRNTEQKETYFAEAKVLKKFTYTSYLDEADAIIDICKLKCHGMMGMTAAAKNMFGTIPGTMKPEYHFRFPSYEDFADIMVDLNEYFKTRLSVCDAVWGMEGNGPTAGTPRQIGALLASASPHALDLCAAKIIGLAPASVPTLQAAIARGLIPESAEELTVIGDLNALCLSDFKNIAVRKSMQFEGDGRSALHRLRGKFLGWALSSRPALKKSLCIGCGVCKNICPAKAIVIDKNKKAVIDRSLCIRCFCCQEFCPKSAMKVHRTPLAKLAGRF